MAAAPPPVSLKEAISRFEKDEYERRVNERNKRHEETGAELEEVAPVLASQEKYVKLMGMLPPISKMDKEITTLSACEHLGLSTNAIEKIGPGLKELKNLKILSLGRNQIKKLEQLELPQLEQLWISYNKIDKLTGLDKLKNLKVLYASNNGIAAWAEIDRLANQCADLVDVLFIGNPLYTNSVSSNGGNDKEYRLMMLQRLPKLAKLDGIPVEPEEREEADARRNAS